MSQATHTIARTLSLQPIRQPPLPTVADQVFQELQQKILKLELPPGTKISESDVASQMGVSRQPVREAFKRLAKLGFLLIRPQSSTTVSLISEEAILRARYIRTALEVKTCRTACEGMTPAGIAALSALITAQEQAIAHNDRQSFHTLDDQFHREICVQAGVGYVWDLIHDSKAHMDRIRMLTLDTTSQQKAYHEHIALLEAMREGRADAAEKVITDHLSRILIQIASIKAEDHSWFTDGTP